LLNLGLLSYILLANLGTRRVTRIRLILPLLIVVAAAVGYLHALPTAGHDLTLEAAGVVAGLLLGMLAGFLVSVSRRADGQLVSHAGAAYAVLWITVIGGRIAFAYGATHWFDRAIGHFSIGHQITGADAWTAAFVIMALTMVLARVAITAIRASRSRAALAPAVG
jgi:hypothetical protein